ncbi:hypothetical protein lerEdw1_020833 [Lerista edwardsae]|nr:hypothetical protein lerEdw1_020833 [Lerista edwardsae]
MDWALSEIAILKCCLSLLSSSGPHACIGEQLARIEIFIVFTSLLRAFTFRPPEGVKELNQEAVVAASTHPHPYKLCAIPLCSAS